MFQPHRRSKTPDYRDRPIAERVKRLFDQGNLTQEELAKELSVSQPHVSRLLLGKTAWRKKYLHRVAELYGTNLNSLLLDPQEVPIVAQIEDDHGFNYAIINQPDVWLGKAPAPPGEYNLAGLYCLQIQGEFFNPFLSQGSLIYARNNGGEIQEDMLVIYASENGYGLLRQVKFADDTIILKSLSPSGKYLIRPKTHLRLLDKVEWIKI